MQRFETPDGAPMTLPAAGVLLPESLGAILDAQPGDEIEIDLPGAGVSTLHLPLTAFTSDTLGNLVFMRDSVLRDALGADADAFAGGLFDTATIRFTTGADAATIATAVQALPDVVVYVPVQADLRLGRVGRDRSSPPSPTCSSSSARSWPSSRSGAR